MGFNNIGGGMNITISLGNPAGNGGQPPGGEVQALQIRFDDAKARLDKNKGDSEALQDLRNLKKDVDSTLRKETAKECGGSSSKQEQLAQLLDMILQVLQQVMGGEEGCGGEGEDGAEPSNPNGSSGLHVTISLQ